MMILMKCFCFVIKSTKSSKQFNSNRKTTKYKTCY